MSEFLQIARNVGRATGTCSFVGSSMIIFMILSDRERKLTRPYHRIMLMMSVFDVFQSLSLTVSVTAVPSQSGIDGAKGNDLTCIMQGFALCLGLAVPIYNSCLNIYYVLTICYNISSEQFSKYEYLLHTICTLFPLSMAVISTFCGYIMPRTNVCVPRGKVFLVVVTIILSTCFFVCIVSMICICWTVSSQAAKTRQYTTFNTRKNYASRMSRADDDKNKTIRQACLYTLTFLLTYTFLFVGNIYTRGRVGVEPPNVVISINIILYPLQGFWNFFFYIRPGIHLVMKSNAEKSYFGAIRDVVFRPDSLRRSNIQVLDIRRLPMHVLPSSEIVQSIATPHIADCAILDESKDVCTKCSSNETSLSVDTHNQCLIENSMLQTSLHDISDSAHSGKVESQVILHSEVITLEDNVEHQSKDQFSSGSSRRFSLPDIASVLDGQDCIGINPKAGYSKKPQLILKQQFQCIPSFLDADGSLDLDDSAHDTVI